MLTMYKRKWNISALQGRITLARSSKRNNILVSILDNTAIRVAVITMTRTYNYCFDGNDIIKNLNDTAESA